MIRRGSVQIMIFRRNIMEIGSILDGRVGWPGKLVVVDEKELVLE